MLIGWINTWNAFEHWTTGLFVVWLCACVCGSGRIFWDSVCCLIMLRSSYFAAQYSKHMKRGMPEVKHHPSCVWFLQSSDRLLSWERLLDCTMYCLVWGEEKFEAENPFLSLFLSLTHTLSLCFSLHEWGLYWRHQLILLEFTRNVKDESGIERGIEKEGLCG